MSTPVPTHGSTIVNNLEWVEQADFVTFPTNPTMKWAAETAVIRWDIDEGIEAFRRLGSEDPFDFLEGKEDFKISAEFGLSNYADVKDFLKYAINAIAGAGTIAKPLGLGFSYKLNDATRFRKVTGVRFEEFRLSGDPDGRAALQGSADFIVRTIDQPNASDYIGVGAHATPSTVKPLTWHKSGANPIQFGPNNLDVTRINMAWKRNLSNKRVMGGRNIKFQRSTDREGTGDFAIVTGSDQGYAATLEADARAQTKRNLVWTIDSGWTITHTNAILKTLSDELSVMSRELNETPFTFESLSSTIA